MNTILVLTLIGPDRPGLVDSLAEIVRRHGGNWIESRMAHLAGQFAGVLRIAVPVESAAALEGELAGLESRGLRVLFVAEPEDESGSAAGVAARLEVMGQDRPGIVAAVSRVLAERGVNVEELRTECSSAPWSGETLFKVHAVLTLPDGVGVDALRSALEGIGGDLMVELVPDAVGDEAS